VAARPAAPAKRRAAAQAELEPRMPLRERPLELALPPLPVRQFDRKKIVECEAVMRLERVTELVDGAAIHP